MRNYIRYLVGLFSIFLFFCILPTPTNAANGNTLANSYAPEETAVFLDGNIKVLKQKTYLADDNNLYVPVKLLNDLDNIKVNYSNNISISSTKGSFILDKSNSQIYQNTTYISLKRFLSITGYSAKHISKGFSVFIWTNKDGQTKSNKIINNFTKIPDGVKYYLGSKVFMYDTNKTGWVIDLKYSGYLTYVTILLNDGKIIEDTILDTEPYSFCLFSQYELIKSGFKGKYYWANSNRLPSSSPLHNIEKVYFTSLDLKDGNLVIKANRANGNKVTLKLPLHGYPSTDIHDFFYFSNPKNSYPNWSKKVWDSIANNRIFIGMTTEQVLMSWGNPNDISTYRSSFATTDLWSYEYDYLYFYNGILDSISTF